MGENLYCPGQKSTNKKYRDNYDRIFGEREEYVTRKKRLLKLVKNNPPRVHVWDYPGE